MMLWLTSRAALPILKNASLPSSKAGERLRALVAEIEAFGNDSVAAALDREITHRAASYLTGLEAYRGHPFRRQGEEPPVLWRDGTTQLLDYGRDAAGPVVLVVPSLINRYYVLDLLPERSFLRHLAAEGLRPVVVDWGAPDSGERDFDLTDYIMVRLDTAFTAASGIGAPIAVVGYCMGGAAGAGTGAAPAGGTRLPGAARDTLGFSRRARRPGADARCYCRVLYVFIRFTRQRTGRRDPRAVFCARPVHGRAQIHALFSA
jgi:polyhydroxyalkanoate synthase